MTKNRAADLHRACGLRWMASRIARGKDGTDDEGDVSRPNDFTIWQRLPELCQPSVRDLSAGEKKGLQPRQPVQVSKPSIVDLNTKEIEHM